MENSQAITIQTYFTHIQPHTMHYHEGECRIQTEEAVEYMYVVEFKML